MFRTLCANLLAPGLACLFTVAASAQPPDPPEDGPPARGGLGGFQAGGGMYQPFMPMAPPLLTALDKDRDGELSEDELGKASESLKSLDRNKDGKLDRAEIHPGPPRGGQGMVPGGRGFRGGPGFGGPGGGPGFGGPGGGPGFGPGGGPGFGGPGGGPGFGPGGGPGFGGPGGGPGFGGPGGGPGFGPGGGPGFGGPGGGAGEPPAREADRADGPGRGPRLGAVLPPRARGELNLSEKQRDQLEDLEKGVTEKLKSILTPDQVEQFQGILGRRPGPRPDGPKDGPPEAEKSRPRR